MWGRGEFWGRGDLPSGVQGREGRESVGKCERGQGGCRRSVEPHTPAAMPCGGLLQAAACASLVGLQD